MTDPRESLVHNDGRAYCPECDWSVITKMDEAFHDHYYEHTDLVKKYSDFYILLAHRRY